MLFDHSPERDETLSRFIYSASHFSSALSRVKPGAFLPQRDTRETSVFRTIGLSRTDIQRIGEGGGGVRSQGLKAWADVMARVVFDIGLDVRPDNVPERHAAIVGWPEEKDRQLSLAQQMAANAALHLAA